MRTDFTVDCARPACIHLPDDAETPRLRLKCPPPRWNAAPSGATPLRQQREMQVVPAHGQGASKTPC